MRIEVDAGGAIRAFGAIARKLDELTARRRPALRPSRFPRRPIERHLRSPE